jgi:hypothetical protein
MMMMVKKPTSYTYRGIYSGKKKKYVDDDTESEKITNIMELAIYHCKGKLICIILLGNIDL